MGTFDEPTRLPELPAVPGYTVEREVGRGGMGVVYRATQDRAGRTVAVKMILGGAAGGVEVARFRSEAAVVSRLAHPNIVAVHEVGEHDGRPFFSMEFCPGGSLAAAPRTFAIQEAVELVRAVACGVAAAHAAGVVHRDLKPGNILFTADGVPKIADFGLAKRVGPAAVGEITATGAVLGTPAYMAPEQAGSARRVGPPADVYALGVVLYELLTGRLPFVGDTPAETLLKALTDDPPPPRSVCPAVPPELEAVCLRCLEKDPARRYESAAGLVDDLTRYLNGEPVSAARHGVVGRLVGAVGRVTLQERFAGYGSLLLALAPVMFLTEVWVTLVVWNDWPATRLIVGQMGRVGGFLAVLWYFRKAVLPRSAAERHLWMVWGGYLFACVVFGFGTRLATSLTGTQIELMLYPGLACLTALAFFGLAANYWGYCAVIGAAYLVLALAMSIDLRFAPLMFGALWAAVLVVMGVRLRRLARPAPSVTDPLAPTIGDAPTRLP